MSNRFACVRVSGNRELWVRDNVLNMEGNIEWFVKHADALLKQARREERERVASELESMAANSMEMGNDTERATLDHAADHIRAMPKEARDDESI